MRSLRLPLLLVAVLVAGACTDPDRLRGGAGANDPNALGLNGGGGDPASPAYFQSTVGDRVLFAVDQSTLGDEAKQVLAGQAQWLNNNTSYSAIVEGHADEQGTREYNLALGARRANAVQEYLISQGVAGTRLRTVTYGKERPLEICSEEACYAKNRRAVTLLNNATGS
ncbi:peptidoglycan-associated lipoprotein Pal [Actibacterium sp. 188UL27-1]|uniref:peptidoglycan-associated lipoprotein Pal n=1 Tax=Actibacterium sp. 188UL27-1 TaxID=2786961 RepID=UPI00351C9C92